MTKKYELCCTCRKETGKAGACEDSLYIGSFGPFCEECYLRNEHNSPEKCSTWYDGCNCTPETCNSLTDRIETLELELETLGANCMKAMELKDEEIEKLKIDLEVSRTEADALDTKIVDLMQEIDRLVLHNKKAMKLKDEEVERLKSICQSFVTDLTGASTAAFASDIEMQKIIDRAETAEAEVKRLRTSTWQQEREAILAYIRLCKIVVGGKTAKRLEILAKDIEYGSHWRKDGESEE